MRKNIIIENMAKSAVSFRMKHLAVSVFKDLSEFLEWAQMQQTLAIWGCAPS